MAYTKRTPMLRITHRARDGDAHSVAVELTGGDFARQEFTATFAFTMSDDERERIQWYLETYLEYPQDPAPDLAVRAQRAIEDVGTRLFRAVFDHDQGARKLWARLEPLLPETRVEVSSEGEAGWSIPWELLHDPSTNEYLSLRARDFVRTHPSPARPVMVPKNVTLPVRILLVISRPQREWDVAYRSIARPLVDMFSRRDDVQIDVLRPPTFDALSKALRTAKAAKRPYHIVHFDGHGVFLDLAGALRNGKEHMNGQARALLASLVPLNPHRFSPKAIYPHVPRDGGRGYLVFENPSTDHNLRFVDGPELGSLLAATGIRALVLNACRSGHVAQSTEEDKSGLTGKDIDRHARVRAFGSLAQEVMDAGVPCVLAMQYNVYVVTATRFVSNLYEALAAGETFGGAVSAGRKDLADDTLRAIVSDPVPLQDWMVPVAYEAAPTRLFKARQDGRVAPITTGLPGTPPHHAAEFDLPASPDHGFFGRDETILALDRAFDEHHIVLLHALAGSGKTSAVAEFARWYALTGGVQGPVLFTSFERYKPLTRVLDLLGRAFGSILERQGIQWLALDDAQRREVALQILEHYPVLWIWDNVEPIAGFPAGTGSTWDEAEQQELVGFLRQAGMTGSKFLLTSRRDERSWLGDLPARLTMPPMPMIERMQLARALAIRNGRRLDGMEEWRPLLRFTAGNPLTIIVTVGQALRDGLTTREQIEGFVSALRAGEAAFDDEPAEGRSKSLAASLSYGFAHAFDDAERQRLALLHLFQGVVYVDALRHMGHLGRQWSLPSMRGVTAESIEALLYRAAALGVLTHLQDLYFAIHPALPWYLKALFDQYYPAVAPADGADTAEQAMRAFAEAMGLLGNYCHQQYQQGKRDLIGSLAVQEDNLLRARSLARANGWWAALINSMQGLGILYEHTGRWSDWADLVREVVPDFVDPATDGPLPGRHEEWTIVTQYRARLAGEVRDWEEADRLQSILLAEERHRAAPALAEISSAVDQAGRHAIESLATALHHLGHIRCEQEDPSCLPLLQEAFDLARAIDNRSIAAVAAFNIGHALRRIPSLRDLAQAERWYRESLDLRDPDDGLGRAGPVGQLGYVAYERFEQARADGREDAARYLNESARLYEQALVLYPPDAMYQRSVVHHQLGMIYAAAVDRLPQALVHYREAIRYDEMQDNYYSAAGTRWNIALHLADMHQFDDALLYARAALRNYESYGIRAGEEVQETRELIMALEKAVQADGR